MALKFYLIESEGFLYCVPSTDVLSVFQYVVPAGQIVKLKYGKGQYEGEVLYSSGREKEVLKELDRVKKEKKKKKRDSFHGEQPRKTRVAKQTDLAAVKTEAAEAASTSKAATNAVKKVKDAKKAEAELAFEAAVANGKGNDEEVNHSTGSISSTEVESIRSSSGNSSASGSSSIVDTNLHDANTNQKKDARHLENLIHPPAPSPSPDLVRTDSPSDYVNNEDRSSGNKIDIKSDEQEVQCNKRKMDESESDSSASSTGKKAKKPKIKKSKKSKRSRKSHKKRSSRKKHRRSPSSSSTSSSSSSSTSSESSSEEERKRPKKVKRNLDVFPGQNFLYNEDSDNVVKLHPKYDVYVKESDVEDAVKNSKTTTNFVRLMVDKIYTREALEGSTAQGFPARGGGRKKMLKQKVLPRLHPDGRAALLDRAFELEKENKMWRPKAGDKAKEAFRGRVGEF